MVLTLPEAAASPSEMRWGGPAGAPNNVEWLYRDRPSRFAAALTTYVDRRLFRALAVVAIVWAAWCPGRDSAVLGALRPALYGLMSLLTIVFPVVAAAAVARHARRQVELARTLRLPGSVAPAVMAATVAFGFVLAVTWAGFWALCMPEYDATELRMTTSPIGLAAVTAGLVAMSAWFGFVARSPWSTLLFACVLLTMWASVGGNPFYYLFEIHTYKPAYVAAHPGAWYAEHLRIQRENAVMRWCVLSVDLTALAALVCLIARVGREREWLRRRLASNAHHRSTSTPIALASMGGTGGTTASSSWWSRALLRRHASPLGIAAPWILTPALAALLLITAALPVLLWRLQHHFPETTPSSQIDILRPLLLVTVVPPIAAAAAWRARRQTLPYESLFPATRRRFELEVAGALAIDLAAYWLAGLAAGIASLAIMSPQWLAAPPLWVGFACSAGTQFVATALLLFALPTRSTPAYAIAAGAAGLLGVVLLWMLFVADPGRTAIESASNPARLQQMLTASAVTAATGCALGAIALVSRRWTELA